MALIIVPSVMIVKFFVQSVGFFMCSSPLPSVAGYACASSRFANISSYGSPSGRKPPTAR